MVDTLSGGVIAGTLGIVSMRMTEALKMSQRHKTAPPTRVSSRSPHSGRSGLIAREKTKKQSAKKKTALDNRFHRTSLV